MTQNAITQNDLIGRGWTKSMIARFFPIPSATKPNPYHRSGPPMKLFEVEEVERIEANNEFTDAQVKAATRKASGKKAAQGRLERTREWVKSIPEPAVPRYPPDELIRLACDSYNLMWETRNALCGTDYDRIATPNSDPTFITRITVNYLRHELTDYEDRLIEAHGRIGADEARQHIRQKILRAIAKVYPDLSGECARQVYSHHQ